MLNLASPTLDSGIHEIVPPAPADADLRGVEDRFIDAWARMAGAFAMDPTMGRVHALIYVSAETLDADGVANRLMLPVEVVEEYLRTLVSWQLVYEQRGGYVAEQDPWTWFVRTIRARQARELRPIRDAIESVRDAARELSRRRGAKGDDSVRVVAQRIDAFASFVADLAKLVDSFVTLGAAPLMKFVSMATRFVPRRAA